MITPTVDTIATVHTVLNHTILTVCKKCTRVVGASRLRQGCSDDIDLITDATGMKADAMFADF
jgi:hypothetical protein